MAIASRSVIVAAALFALSVPVGAAEPVPGAAASASAGDQKIICRKTAEIGSLVKKKKECFTKAEWDAIAEAHQRGVKKVQDGLTEKFACDPTNPNGPSC